MVDRAGQADSLADRIARHQGISTELLGLGDEELLRWLSASRLQDRSHAALSLPASGAKVFVKLLPLTALELQPEHRHSTANVFGLPTYYQYRLGSCGFGAWRELDVHRIANQWVLSGQCPHVVLLHHWRVLPLVSGGPDDRLTLEHWGNDPAIRRRVSSVADATASAVLFLEYFPTTLGQWFGERRTDTLESASAILDAEATLLELLAFINGQGLLHMDTHFENILTDGSHFFLSDHGLAISRSFHLDADEEQFFERHVNFDRCTAITSLVHALVAPHDAREDWRQALREINDGTHSSIDEVPQCVRSYLSRRAPLAFAVGDFYARLTADITTEYPASTLQHLLDDS